MPRRPKKRRSRPSASPQPAPDARAPQESDDGDAEFEEAFRQATQDRTTTQIAVLGARLREHERTLKVQAKRRVEASAVGIAARRARASEVVVRVLKAAGDLRDKKMPERSVAGATARKLNLSSAYVRRILKKAKPTGG